MEANFIGEVADIYKCIVCHLALKDPVLIIDCGHRLCKLCFESLQKYASKHSSPLLCPHDRKEVEVEKVVEDKGVARTVLDLQVHCDNTDEGCTWCGELRQLEDHVDKHCRVTSLKKFMEKVEKRLDEKDNEVKELQGRLLLKDQEIEKISRDMDQQFIAMDKRLKDVEGHLRDKDEEIALLRYELSGIRIGMIRGGNDDKLLSHVPDHKKRKVDDVLGESSKENMGITGEINTGHIGYYTAHPDGKGIRDIQSLNSEVKELDKRIAHVEFKNASVNSEFFRLKDGMLNNHHLVNPAKSYKGCSSDCLHCKQIRNLEERVMNVDSYVPGKCTVFVWKLRNYSYYENRGANVSSPEFYSSIPGRCCSLVLSWDPLKSPGVWIMFHSGVRHPDDVFLMNVNFSVVDKNGNICKHLIPKTCFRDNAERFLIKPGKKFTCKAGCRDFINHSSIKDFVIDDVLTLKCEMTYD